ncbi:TPA: DUF551 domain-containing protein [Klebsiella pneumoniae]|nr:DUF551 domain-containing protein [Klebsiella pneumoniae]
MTKSTITRERLEKIAAGRVDARRCNDDEIAMAITLLAAMDSEPVAVVEPSDYVTAAQLVGEESIRKAVRELYEGALRIGDKLYRHAQPALVVPDEIKHRIGGLDWGFEGEFNRGWNACRAAMLQAEPVRTCPSGDGSLRWPCQVHPGNNPEIQDAWIPVSEQMPEIGDIVLTSMGGVVNVGETECSAANCRFFTSVISGRELPATHWMPLPAGPQEGK